MKKLLLMFFFRKLSFLIPKKKGLLAFTPWHSKGVSGNIKNLILYSNSNYSEGKVVLLKMLSANNKDYKKLSSLIPENVFQYYWNLIRAEFVIIDATIPEYAGWNLKIIQLWHGVGFKKVGLINRNNISNPAYYDKLKKHYQQYVLITASSEDDLYKKNAAFETNKSIVTGSPGNDSFFNDSVPKSEILEYYGLQTYSRIICYVPTYRENETFPPFSALFWEQLNDYLAQINAFFIVKKHPWDKFLQVPKNLTHVKDFSSQTNDVQELLLISDILISDYSSIITDFSITGKPILLYMYDLEEYLNTNRSFYYDLKEILPQPFVYNEEELLKKIQDLSWTESKEYQESYKNFRKRFHKYLDGNSSKRVLEAIKSL